LSESATFLDVLETTLDLLTDIYVVLDVLERDLIREPAQDLTNLVLGGLHLRLLGFTTTNLLNRSGLRKPASAHVGPRLAG
jgi:hypothetical protein